MFEKKLKDINQMIENKSHCKVIKETNERKYSSVEYDSDKMLTHIIDIELGKQYLFRLTICNDLRLTSVEVHSPLVSQVPLFSSSGHRMDKEMTPDEFNSYKEALVNLCKSYYMAEINIISSLVDDIEDDLTALAKLKLEQ